MNFSKNQDGLPILFLQPFAMNADTKRRTSEKGRHHALLHNNDVTINADTRHINNSTCKFVVLLAALVIKLPVHFTIVYLLS